MQKLQRQVFFGTNIMSSCSLYPRLYFDGCSKSNPGKAGAGAHLLVPLQMLRNSPENARPYDHTRDLFFNFREVWSTSEYLGDKVTNNAAEYKALIKGLEGALNYNNGAIKGLDVYGDSLLVINQMKGQWKIKEQHLHELNSTAKALCAGLNKRDPLQIVTFTHVMRESNRRADQLANEALRTQENTNIL